MIVMIKTHYVRANIRIGKMANLPFISPVNTKLKLLLGRIFALAQWLPFISGSYKTQALISKKTSLKI